MPDHRDPNADPPPSSPWESSEAERPDDAIEFRELGPESAPAAGPRASAPADDREEPAWRPAGAGGAFEIEMFDEEREPQAGSYFAEIAPEPPPQPEELIHAPARGRKAGSGGAEPWRLGMAETLDPAVRRPQRRPPLALRLWWGLMPLILLVAGYASVIFSQDGVGYAWDEAYYYRPSLQAIDWLLDLARGQTGLDQASVDYYWEERHEHPSVQKFLSGFALHFFPNPESQLFAMRLPMAVLFGLTLSLIYLLGRRAWGTMPGLIAALIYLTLPRVFGHAHFASMETPLVFMTLLVVFCFLRGLFSPTWAVATGVAFGLLLATKINGFFLPIPLLVWAHLFARRRYVNNVFAMLFLGPVVMVAVWPWLWHDTVHRLLEYLAFHASHQQTALYFLGRKWGYGGVNAPWFYPLVMIGVTLPLFSLALVIYGILRTLFRIRRRPLGALFVLCAAVLLGVACAPVTPRYDGVRLFLPVFPFLALLGGAGLESLIRRIQRWTARSRRFHDLEILRVGHLLTAGAALAILAEGVTALVLYHPFYLSYFNPLVGGLEGAERRGFETTYWGEALNEEVIETLNGLPDRPDGAPPSIRPLALHGLNLAHLQEWGLLRADLRFDAEPPYDYHLLLMRRGFFNRPERALADTRAFPIERRWLKFGVPMIALYRTGEAFEQFWPTMPPNPPVGQE